MELSDEKKFLNAAEKGDLDAIKSLIKTEKISLERHDEIGNWAGNTALIYASVNGNLSVVRFLLKEKSVDVDRKNICGHTALHCASQYGNMEIMECLINKGANVNQRHEYGETPLHCASRSGGLSAVKLLLQRGADPLMEDNFNETALDEARQKGHNDVENAILQHIRRQEQTQELIRCNDRLPIAVWPNALSRLESVGFVFQVVCEVPHLFQQAAEASPTQREKNQKPRRLIARIIAMLTRKR